ncbi:MAG: hypothetical protein H6907_03595 [Hyphomicrobiales bacterium]|nr:hypothetical protein [Hyphomicrobiales bacterium]MCP5370793.1 hypothetical protein [Hyphomicrobiales bacterium]
MDRNGQTDPAAADAGAMRALKGLVIGLGVMIVIAMVALAYALYYKSQNPDFKLFGGSSPGTEAPAATAAAPEAAAKATPEAAPEATAGPVRSFGDINLRLPPDGQVSRLAADGRRLFLQVDAPDGGRIVVIDLTNGAVLGTIHLQRSRP